MLSNLSRVALGAAALAGLLALSPVDAAPANYGFSVTISLSAKAAALLKAKKEAIEVSAEYGGDPIPAKEQFTDPGGQIALGTEVVTIPGANGRAVFTGNKVEIKHLGWIKGGLNVNVAPYTARRSGPDNLIDCGNYEGPLAAIQAKPFAFTCKLIGEP